MAVQTHVIVENRRHAYLRAGGLVLWLGWLLGGCGSGSAAAGSARQATQDQCLDATASGSLCEALVSYVMRCTSPDNPRQELGQDCRSTWGHFAERANGCFVDRLNECLSGPCDAVDAEQCFRQATVASDPDSFDASASEACTVRGECSGAAEGWMARCVQRFEACGIQSESCATAVSLKRRYRAEAEGCFDEDCEVLEDCVYAVTGY